MKQSRIEESKAGQTRDAVDGEVGGNKSMIFDLHTTVLCVCCCKLLDLAEVRLRQFIEVSSVSLCVVVQKKSTTIDVGP